jgi:DNA-binding NarL/FixJ family response regulator
MKEPLTNRLSEELHRNKRIVELIAHGHTVKEVAAMVHLSHDRVQKKLDEIRQFYNAKNVTELVQKLLN